MSLWEVFAPKWCWMTVKTEVVKIDLEKEAEIGEVIGGQQIVPFTRITQTRKVDGKDETRIIYVRN